LSRDGNWFTIVPTDDLENSTDTTIAVWHVPTQSKRFEWPRYRSNREQLTTSQVSPNGDWLVQTTIDPANTRDQNRAGVIINLRTGRRHELPASAWTALVSAFSRDESLIAIAFEDRSVELFRVSTGELLLRLPASNQKIRDLWFAPNGTDLVLLGEHHVTVQILKVNAIRRQLADLGLDW
jgi:WD40 repeat protein